MSRIVNLELPGLGSVLAPRSRNYVLSRQTQQDLVEAPSRVKLDLSLGGRPHARRPSLHQTMKTEGTTLDYYAGY